MNTHGSDTATRLLLFGVLTVVLIATNSAGHDWGGDFSQYIHHAVNLVEGRPYTEIGHIRNPGVFVGPEAYPPLFPLLLAPVYWLFGLDWFAMKTVGVVSFCLALYVLTAMETGRLDRAHQLVLVLALVFNPYFWAFKEKILSDLPFLLACLLSLALLQLRYVREAGRYRDTDNNLHTGLLLGLLLYLGYAAREAGIVVVVALVCFELFHFRRLTRATLLALGVFTAAAGLQHYALQSHAPVVVQQQPVASPPASRASVSAPATHLETLGETLSLTSVLLQIRRYAEAVREIWPGGRNALVRAAGWTAFLLALVFAAAGYLRAVVGGPGVTEIFVAGYLAAILIFAGYQGVRYLIPVIPFFFVYAFRLHRDLLHAGRRRSMIAVAGVFIAATTVSYAAGYRADARVMPMGITTAPAVAFFDHVRQHTPADSVFIFQRPRVLALLTGRQASVWPRRVTDESLLAYMRSIGADYLVVSRILWNGNCRPVKTLPALPAQLTQEYGNDYFLLYRLAPGAGASPAAPPGPAPAAGHSSKGAGFRFQG